MLNIHLAVVGDKMPDWVDDAFEAYKKRLSYGKLRLNLIEVPAQKRAQNADIARIMEKEEQQLLRKLPDNVYRIALDRKGKQLSTLEMVNRMTDWLHDATQVAFLVGGPEGLSQAVVAQAHETWSLSKMTFAHPIVRIIFAEQIYRCHSIIEGQPYHR